MGFIPVLTVLPAAKLELWHFTLGEDLAPWLAVFLLYVLLPLFYLFCSFPPKPALCREKFHNLVILVKAMTRLLSFLNCGVSASAKVSFLCRRLYRDTNVA